MKVLLTLTGMAVLVSTSAAQAETRGQFCARWHNVCTKTSPASFQATCSDRLARCRENGCYHFNAFPPQCQSAGVPACSQIHEVCTRLGVNPNCEAARARCMRTGRWIGDGKVDFGPARKQ